MPSPHAKLLAIQVSSFPRLNGYVSAWDEATLAQFLGIGLPDNLKSEVDAAGPLVFRSVQRLGSFPWWDRPTGPSLQLHCLGTALIFLICRINLYRHYDTRCISLSPGDMPVRGELLPQNAAPAERDEGSECESSGDENSEDEDSKFQKRIYIKWYSRLLFQSMSIRSDRNTFPDTPAANDSDPSSKEEPGDIDYLSQAYSIVSRGNFQRHPNNPKIGARGPPIIPKSELPPSNYSDVSGSIPVEQFQAFFKLLVAALHHRRRDLEGDIFGDEIELDEVESRIERLDQVVADALKLSNESVESPGISWSQFETIASTEMVCVKP